MEIIGDTLRKMGDYFYLIRLWLTLNAIIMSLNFVNKGKTLKTFEQERHVIGTTFNR